MQESHAALRKQIAASGSKQKGGRLSHYPSHSQNDTCNNTGHGGRQKNGTYHIPFGSAHSQRTAAVAFRYGFQCLLGIPGDQGQHHQCECKCTGQNRVSKTQGRSEKYHTEKAENNRRDSGKDFCGKFNRTHYFSGFGIFIQIDRGSYANRRGDQQGNNNNI